MIKCLGVTHQNGTLQDGKAWANYHIYCVTDELSSFTNERLLCGVKCLDIKVSDAAYSVICSVPAEQLKDKSLKLTYLGKTLIRIDIA